MLYSENLFIIVKLVVIVAEVRLKIRGQLLKVPDEQLYSLVK